MFKEAAEEKKIRKQEDEDKASYLYPKRTTS
jgi:hypothetical protein